MEVVLEKNYALLLSKCNNLIMLKELCNRPLTILILSLAHFRFI